MTATEGPGRRPSPPRWVRAARPDSRRSPNVPAAMYRCALRLRPGTWLCHAIFRFRKSRLAMTDSSGCKLSELLPTDLGEVTQTLREELGKNIDRPEPGLLPFLGAQAADALGGILDVDVFEVLARGWVTARELQELADDERYPPDKTVTVTLGKHEFTT